MPVPGDQDGGKITNRRNNPCKNSMECIKNSDCQKDEFCNDPVAAGSLNATDLYQCKKTSQPNDPCKESTYCPTGYGCYSKAKKCREECIAGSSPNCFLDPVENKHFLLRNSCTSSSECGASAYCAGNHCLTRSILFQMCSSSSTPCAEGLGCSEKGTCSELCSSKHFCKTGFYCKKFNGKNVGICTEKEVQPEYNVTSMPQWALILIYVGVAVLIAIIIGCCFLFWFKRYKKKKKYAATYPAPVWVAMEPPNYYKI